MSMQHVFYKAESPYGTWVTPDRAILVESFDVDADREKLKMELSGSPNRARVLTVLGAKPVAGSLAMPFWMTNVKSLFKTAITSITHSSPGMVSYDDSFLFDDTALPAGISFQTVYNSGTGRIGKSILGAVISKFTISGATKEPWKLNFSLEAKDEALSKVTSTDAWDYNPAVAAPNLITPPAYPTLQRPFMFYDSTIGLDDTAPTVASGKIAVTSVTNYAKIKNFEVAVDLGLDTDGYGMTSDPTRIEMVPGNRVTMVKFEMSWSDYAHYFYDQARAGTAMVFQATAIGTTIADTYKNEAHVIVPAVVFDAAKLPPIDGSNARKFVTVEGEAISCPTIDKDFNLWIVSNESVI